MARALQIVRHGEPEGLVVAEIQVAAPQGDEITIDVHAAGVNFPDLLVVRGTYRSARPYYVGIASGYTNVLGLGNEQMVMAPGYFDLEAQLSYTWRWFRVFVNGYNLLNSGDQSYNPRPPRGVIGGLQVDL